jgi:hypothetical protein
MKPRLAPGGLLVSGHTPLAQRHRRWARSAAARHVWPATRLIERQRGGCLRGGAALLAVLWRCLTPPVLAGSLRSVCGARRGVRAPPERSPAGTLPIKLSREAGATIQLYVQMLGIQLSVGRRRDISGQRLFEYDQVCVIRGRKLRPLSAASGKDCDLETPRSESFGVAVPFPLILDRERCLTGAGFDLLNAVDAQGGLVASCESQRRPCFSVHFQPQLRG